MKGLVWCVSIVGMVLVMFIMMSCRCCIMVVWVLVCCCGWG